jgi:Family of unknown function (DUF6459)
MPAPPPAPFSAIRLYRVPSLAPPYDDDAPSDPIPPRSTPLPAVITPRADNPPATQTDAEAPGLSSEHPPRQPNDATLPGESGQQPARGPGDAAQPGHSSEQPPRGPGDAAHPGQRAAQPAREPMGTLPELSSERPPREPKGAALPELRSEQRGTSARATREGSAFKAPGGERDSRASGTDWPSQFAQVLAETLAGARPPGQLAKWTTERARSRIRSLGPTLTVGQQLAGHRVQPRVHRVVTSQPAAGVVEMSVVVGFGEAIRALAVRLERTLPQPARPGRPAQPARWLCTALEAG